MIIWQPIQAKIDAERALAAKNLSCFSKQEQAAEKEIAELAAQLAAELELV